MNSNRARPPSSDPDESAQDRSVQDESAPDPKEQQKAARKIDLSLTQVIGGSLAAATAAALGSKLGVAGTIIGAAMVSVISAVAASLYTTSLRRTRAAAKAAVQVVRVKRLDGQRPSDIALDSLPTSIVGKVRRRGTDSRAIGRDAADPSGTAVHDAGSQTLNGGDTAGSDGVRDDSEQDAKQVEQLQVDVPAGKPRRLRTRPVLIGAGAIFIIAVVGITGYELASGESISGGNRTSLQQVVEGKTPLPSTPSQPSDTQNQAPSSSTSAPRDGTSTAPATPSTGESSSPSEGTTSPPSTTTPPETTEPTTPPATPTQPAAPTGNSKPEAGGTTPATPTDATPPGP